MNKTVEEILEELKTTGRSQVNNFGVFTTKVRKGREGVSSFNGKAYKTDDKVVITFKPSKSLDTSSFKVN